MTQIVGVKYWCPRCGKGHTEPMRYGDGHCDLKRYMCVVCNCYMSEEIILGEESETLGYPDNKVGGKVIPCNTYDQ